jgi:hypothetical protein
VSDDRVLVTSDSRNRIAMNRLGVAPEQRYLGRVEEDGTITLTPIDIVERGKATGEVTG